MAANHPASAAVVVETAVHRSHLMAARNLVAVAVGAERVAVEIVPNLNRPRAPSTHRLVEEGEPASWAAVH